jgi:hypothetical protein
MALTRRRQALALVALGCTLVVAGVALVYLPAAIILAGLALAAAGLLGIEVDK